MDSDLSSVQTQISGVNSNATVVLNGSIFNLCPLVSDGDKNNDLVPDKFDTATTPSLISDGNIFTIESSKGKILSVADDVNNVSDLGLGSVNAGLEIATSTVPSQLLQHDPATSSDSTNASFIQVITSVDTTKSTVTPISTILEVIPSTSTLIQSVPGLKRRGGWPKGKKRKEVESSSIPKPPTTGYVLFSNQNRKHVKDQNPDACFSDVTKLLGAEWSALDAMKKQKYLDEAEDDKKRYIAELKAYRENAKCHVKKKIKILRNGCGEELEDMGRYDVDDVTEDMLYCKVCDQYFSSCHNRKEHMFGKTHLSNVSEAIEKVVKEESSANELQTLPVAPQPAVDPLDIQACMLQILDSNNERELELRHLRKTVQNLQAHNVALINTIKEYEEIHNKYIQDVGNAKAYGSALATQINTLRMVPTLFGVINF